MTPHSANWAWSHSSRCIYCRRCPTRGKYLEFSIEGQDYYPWQYGLFRNDPYRVEDGHMAISGEPGWGIEIEPEWLARSRYHVSETP